MRGGWSRFWLYIVVVAVLVVAVVAITSGIERTAAEVVAQVLFIGAMAYLLTFIVWPRRTPLNRRHHTVDSPAKPAARPRPTPDARPVVVIENRPAGSRPGSRVHVRESQTARNSRGRRPSDRRQPTNEMRWPTR